MCMNLVLLHIRMLTNVTYLCLKIFSHDAKLKYKMPQQGPSSKFYTNVVAAADDNTKQQFGIPLSM